MSFLLPVVECVGHGRCEIRGAAALDGATEHAQAVWLDPAISQLLKDLIQFAGLDGTGRGKAEHHAAPRRVARFRSQACTSSAAHMLRPLSFTGSGNSSFGSCCHRQSVVDVI
ncbi:hypothetical protein ASF59_15645 [Methylobacterium sp. Leaf121]|nr:hypothetical protein ASF59_15645 [Methylobacterium sp. Leaf121]